MLQGECTMSRRWLTEDHRIFQDSIRRFVEKEIIPNIDQWEKDRLVPRQIWRKMGEQGFLCPCLPVEYGGSGVDFSYSVIVQEELTRSTCSGVS
ncbi:MAG TPA: acyl-CoA dehydrogenase family protein, partial [Desulfobacterales bacterium]|nr:acyl-CoA dehydrogenase family protein [Desulfobacterales bacterium]